MAVLKTTSPTASPAAPTPIPCSTVPSARARTPVAPLINLDDMATLPCNKPDKRRRWYGVSPVRSTGAVRAGADQWPHPADQHEEAEGRPEQSGGRGGRRPDREYQPEDRRQTPVRLSGGAQQGQAAQGVDHQDQHGRHIDQDAELAG